MEAFSELKTPSFVFDATTIRRHLRALADADVPVTVSDQRTRSYYLEGKEPMLWIDRWGVDSRADSLLSWLHGVGACGLSERAFLVNDLERDLQALRTLHWQDADLNSLAARLEYRLTKACLRYCYGQRFGYMNPRRVFNHRDVEKEDTTHHQAVKYRQLFDLAMDQPAQNHHELVFRKIRHDSIAQYLDEIQPRSNYYQLLCQMLRGDSAATLRPRLLANLERSRWRLHQPIPETGKRILVNIPAFHLYAYGEDTLLHMRIACGAQATKTPLLSSAIEWMEVNPQWVIPMSIIKNDVVRHAGDSFYFARNRYEIYDKETRKTLDASQVSRSMLLSGRYRVAQRSGADNSLGQIVFRFKNNFSVYLHYTSSPGVFRRDVRAVSHGCVRVERPFPLANYVLDDPDEWLLDRIRISMDLGAKTERGKAYLRAHQNDKEHHLISYVPVKPSVPLFIIYYTLWPDHAGTLRSWPDVYGYDQTILESLKPFID